MNHKSCCCTYKPRGQLILMHKGNHLIRNKCFAGFLEKPKRYYCLLWFGSINFPDSPSSHSDWQKYDCYYIPRLLLTTDLHLACSDFSLGCFTSPTVTASSQSSRRDWILPFWGQTPWQYILVDSFSNLDYCPIILCDSDNSSRKSTVTVGRQQPDDTVSEG